MSLRRSTRIQQAVVSPTSSINDSSTNKVQQAAKANTTSERSQNSRKNNSKGNQNPAEKSNNSKDATQPRPQNKKRRRLNTSEGRDGVNEKLEGKEAVGGNLSAAKPHKKNALPLAEQQTRSSTGLTKKESRKDGVAETAVTDNKVVNEDTVAAAATDNVLEKANAYLVSQDPGLADLIKRHPCEMFSPAGLQEVIHPFQNLVTGILAQQACKTLDFLKTIGGSIQMYDSWFS